jgi:hypothetical protein
MQILTLHAIGPTLSLLLGGWCLAEAVPTLPSSAECAEHVAAFEGAWYGKDNPAPFGPMDMAFAFAREADGSLRALSAQSPLTWIELLFYEEDGRWRLRETAAMEGLGEQSYTMDLVAAQGQTYRWEVLERPGFMTMTTSASGEEIALEVLLRGKPHVSFRLQRVPGAAGEQLAAQLAVEAKRVVRETPVAAVQPDATTRID